MGIQAGWARAAKSETRAGAARTESLCAEAGVGTVGSDALPRTLARGLRPRTRESAAPLKTLRRSLACTKRVGHPPRGPEGWRFRSNLQHRTGCPRVIRMTEKLEAGSRVVRFANLQVRCGQRAWHRKFSSRMIVCNYHFPKPLVIVENWKRATLLKTAAWTDVLPTLWPC